jgi:tRNA(Ile)-lysidine synthase
MEILGNDKHKIIYADALEALKTLPDNSVDLIFADPPYFLSNNGLSIQSGQIVSVNKGAWDKSEGFDFICTAHHLDDQLETFLINLSRGTGIHGLRGIPAMQNNICRPLLTFSRAQIENYAQSHKISWREDASNQSDSYLRNKIRHQITPPLKSISSDFLSTFQKTLIYLRDSQDLIYDALQRFQDEAVMQKDDQTMINIEKLLQFQNPKAYLYAFLSPFGFTAWEDIFQLIQSQSGKWVDSPSHRLLKNRSTLLLTRSKIQENECFYVI